MTARRFPTMYRTLQQFAGDIHRPCYHFLPPSNWMNDPNGLIQWGENYHLFYQYNPAQPFHGNIHWGHAVSPDLVHWRDLPVALAPTPGGPDKDGCWSGCAVDHDGVPTLLYTGARPEVQCVATGSPNLLEWTKYPGNPVIAAPPDGLEVTGFRDPCVWREDGVWYMVLGSGIKGVGGTVFLYRSRDLLNWEYLHPLCMDDQDKTADMWECPSFFPLGDKHILIVSLIAYNTTVYFVGTYRDHKFEPEYQGRLDHANLFYAPQSFLDRTGRRLVFGWLLEARQDSLIKAAGWSGVQSVPRVLTLRPDGRLGIEPAVELQTLRGLHTHFSDLDLSPETPDSLNGLQGNCLEIVVEFERKDATQYGIKVLRAPNGEEETTVVYDHKSRQLIVDRTRSCANPADVDTDPQAGSLELNEGELLQLHIFLDRSIIEIFANGHLALTSRIYPSRADSLGIEIFARGGHVTVPQIDIWHLNSIW